MDGKIKDIAFDAIAPTMLNTSSMSYTETDIAIIIANKIIVYIMKNTFACFFRFTLSSV
jgi:hypothetical protein